MYNGATHLVESHYDYAKNLARQFYKSKGSSTLSLDDVTSSAFLGLCDASRRFDPERGITFKSFSYDRVVGEMIDSCRVDSRIAHSAIKNNLTDSEFTTVGISERVGNSKLSETLGVNVLVSHKSGQVEDFHYANENLEQEVHFKYLKEMISGLMDKVLTEEEHTVIHAIYYEGLSLSAISSKYSGKGRSWLCKVHLRALAKLRKAIRNTYGKDFADFI